MKGGNDSAGPFITLATAALLAVIIAAVSGAFGKGSSIGKGITF